MSMVTRASLDQRAPGVHVAFEELYQLLRTTAGGGVPDRAETVTYSNLRATLLDSQHASLLPGFVSQCHSLFKFREFISLYDCDPAVREAFIRTMFEKARSAFEIEGAFDRPEAAKPVSRGWSM